MSRPDYDVGDLVVCVEPFGARPDLAPRVGTIWRVEALLAPSRLAGWGVRLEGKTCGPYRAFEATKFRKVDPLPDALTSLLASKPVRQSVPA